MQNDPPLELPESNRARIRAEEIYREEVRAEVTRTKTSKTRRQRLWSLLNTSFGIWLLSSVVLGGLGFLYTSTQSLLTESRIKASSIRKLDTEIASRLRQWSRLGEVEEIKRDHAVPGSFARYYGWLVKAPDQSGKFLYVIYPVFPEFEHRPLLSLITELRSYVDGAEAKELDQTIDRLISWNPMIDPQSSFASYKIKVEELLWLSRWRKLAQS
jgi:hypothetical protein